MKIRKGVTASLFAVAALALASLALANETVERKPAQQRRSAPAAVVRQHGTPVGHNRIIIHNEGGHVVEAVHPVIADHRPIRVVQNDRTIVRVRVGFYPAGHVDGRWDHWHRDWGIYWRFADWSRISEVLCEATNPDDGALYPVNGFRGDFPNVWNNEVANQLTENALDQCYSDSEARGVNPSDCTMIEWECRYIPLP